MADILVQTVKDLFFGRQIVTFLIQQTFWLMKSRNVSDHSSSKGWFWIHWNHQLDFSGHVGIERILLNCRIKSFQFTWLMKYRSTTSIKFNKLKRCKAVYASVHMKGTQMKIFCRDLKTALVLSSMVFQEIFFSYLSYLICCNMGHWHCII